MNRSSLIRTLAERAELSRERATRVVDALFSSEEGIISEALRNRDAVSITGFGTFAPRERKARLGRNPRTGKVIEISPSQSAGFRPARGLRGALGDDDLDALEDHGPIGPPPLKQLDYAAGAEMGRGEGMSA